MKAFFILIPVALLLAGCYGNNGEYTPFDGGYSETGGQYDNAVVDYIIDITGPDVAMQIHDIQIFRNEYLGRTIRFTGMFFSSYWGDEVIYFVARTGGGCCGTHGFEVYLNEFSSFDDETWVEVTGIFEEFFVEEDDQYFVRLNVISLVLLASANQPD